MDTYRRLQLNDGGFLSGGSFLEVGDELSSGIDATADGFKDLDGVIAIRGGSADSIERDY